MYRTYRRTDWMTACEPDIGKRDPKHGWWEDKDFLQAAEGHSKSRKPDITDELVQSSRTCARQLSRHSDFIFLLFLLRQRTHEHSPTYVSCCSPYTSSSSRDLWRALQSFIFLIQAYETYIHCPAKLISYKLLELFFSLIKAH